MKVKFENIISFLKTYYLALIIPAVLLLVLTTVVILVFDKKIMPEFTRSGQELSVPDVTGMSIKAAREILHKEGLNLSEEITDKIDYNHPAGLILNQHPKAGSKCKKDRKIYVTVSKGALPVTVPYLIGLSPQDAKYRIYESKLNLDSVLYEFSEEFPEGVVMGQSLVEKDTVGPGDSLFIVISVGKHPSEFVIPDLKGEILKKAVETIHKSGFKVSEIVYMKNEEFLPNTVLDQKPAPGEIVYQGAEIRLLVSSLKDHKK